MKKVFFSPNYLEISGNKKIKMSRLLTSTIGHTLCSSSSPVLPPPAAVLALALGHGGDLHAVAAIIGPWGSHGDVVLLWPCPATTCMLAMVAACMPWLLDTSFNSSLGSPYSFVHYVRTASLPQVSNLGSLSTHKLWPSLWPELWVERQSKAALINMWGFDDVPCPPVHFRPHCGKNFHAIFFFFMCSSNPNTYEAYVESVAYLWREQLIHQAAYVWIRRGRWQWIYCGICRKVT